MYVAMVIKLHDPGLYVLEFGYVLKGCGFFAEFSVCISAGFFNLLEHIVTACNPRNAFKSEH